MEMGTFWELGGEGGFGGGGVGGVSGIGWVFLVHYVNPRDTLSLTPPCLGQRAVPSAVCTPIRPQPGREQGLDASRSGLGWTTSGAKRRDRQGAKAPRE